MLERKRSINTIVHRQLSGELSEAEKRRLEEWLNDSPENRRKYERFMANADFAQRYQCYTEADDEEAWLNFQKKHISVHRSSHRLNWKRISGYAAMLLLPIAGVLISMWILKNNDFTPEESLKTEAVMMRSQQMGKQKATLVLASGRKVNLKSALGKPLQMVEELAPYAAHEEDGASPLNDTSPSDEAPLIDETENNQLLTHPDSEYWVTFEDGTSVHLNYNTTLKYPTHFSSHHRTVYLDGEAYFNVAKDSKRPFRVVTSAGVVTEYGTSFNVNTYTEGCTKVVLVEGSIGVTPNITPNAGVAPNAGKEQKIAVGEMAVLYESYPEVEVMPVDVNSYVAWNEGRFVFENCSLESLMEVLSQWYGKAIQFATDDIRKMQFTGDIDRYSSIEPVLMAIQRVTELEITMNNDRILLKRHNINN